MYNKLFKNKTLLVTGGTGSFGKHLVKTLLQFDTNLIIYSRDELKQFNMRQEFKSNKIKYIIGDIRDTNATDNAFKNVDFVFHAAALKQVPSCEIYPNEAVLTNVIGSNNVIEASIKNNVKKLILLSTDKAVEPINAMGTSKSLMEKLAIAKSNTQDKTKISIVRYGNVLFSRGSVIPLFLDKIEKNEPVPITDPNMTRFLLKLEDAISLVLFAFKKNSNGSIFVKKSPACKIIDLANALYDLKKKEANIITIGDRIGEKKHEKLISSSEMSRSKIFKEYVEIQNKRSNLNFENYFYKGKKNDHDDYTSDNTKQLSNDDIKKLIISCGISL